MTIFVLVVVSVTYGRYKGRMDVSKDCVHSCEHCDLKEENGGGRVTIKRGKSLAKYVIAPMTYSANDDEKMPG